MTDVTKYRNISLNHKTYSRLDKLSKSITPGIRLSISKTVESLVSDRESNPHKQGTNGYDDKSKNKI